MRRLLFGIIGLCFVLGLTACWGAKKNPEVTPTAEERAEYAAQNPFGEERFDMPVGLEHRADYPELIYIIEKQGRIISKSLKSPLDKPEIVLDIGDRVYDEEGEQGLLGLAFHPKNPDQAYVNYTTETHTIIARYDADPANPNRLVPASEKILLSFEQPYANHNGGQLAFGPDGYLYIATGDGGSGGDPHNKGQNLGSMLGKILRIDVDGTTGEKSYTIPSDNPFLDGEAPEIYAYGLRNPWRFSFDEATGKLWAADVGQNRLEEINVIEKGGNYGWRIQEGTECFEPDSGCDKTDLEQPIYTYGRDLGVSITGGFVYRGQRLPGLIGWYVYADYGTGTIWALRQEEDGTVENRTLLQSDANITSFGKDATGEIYYCTQEGQILKIF
ncbi:PQQ-dependent sugar dehydrogenase [Cohnella luojiensis]|uniref:Glucose sorbosone dehydrogenase n=1 Tax=Cohnella luojiensis TaxID=652876 RepID=A0A4Y8LPI6_9BACL|nr:PQQ-dependent sugar dehydrogenase [Cohnella luojiensis]TFE19704.1 glucose sorbosone dehydrogenase [Cohnella luojiensis]